MIAECMKNATTCQLRRIGCDLVIIVSLYLWIEVGFIKLFCLLRLYEDQIQKIDEAFFELL